MSVKSSELHGEQASTVPYSEGQFQKLVEVISRSQHGYRDLIDNLDQAVFTISPEGEVHVANRYLVEMLGVTFQDLIGHNLAEFLDSPTITEAKQHLSSFRWQGLLVRNHTGAVETRKKASPLSMLAAAGNGRGEGHLRQRLGAGRHFAA